MSPQACLVNKPVCQLQGFRLEEIIFTSVKSPQQVAVMSCKEYRAANEGDSVSKVAKITSSMSFIHRCLKFYTCVRSLPSVAFVLIRFFVLSDLRSVSCTAFWELNPSLCWTTEIMLLLFSLLLSVCQSDENE